MWQPQFEVGLQLEQSRLLLLQTKHGGCFTCLLTLSNDYLNGGEAKPHSNADCLGLWLENFLKMYALIYLYALS